MDPKNSRHFRFSHAELVGILDASPVGMIVSSIDGHFEYANSALIEMLGYQEEEIYQADLIITHDDDIEVSQQIREQLLRNPDHPVVMEKRYVHKRGKTILGLMSMIALTNSEGDVERFVAQIIDIEYRKKMEKSADLFRSMINASRDAMFIIDPPTGKILDANIQGCKSLGYTYDEMIELEITQIEKEISSSIDWQEHVEEIRQKKHMLLNGDHFHKSGKIFPVEMSLSYLVQDEFEYLLAIVRDVTERKKTEAVIWEQANYDMLTGLPNRNMLHDRLEHGIKKAHRSSTKIAVLCLDLDKFKEVNDTLGHHVGDKLLKEAGRRLNGCVREIDTVARLGGDEFCILIEQVDEVANVDRIASSILDALAEPFMLGVNKAFISTSIGITFYPDDSEDVDGLLKNSDQAMYFAKNRGRNCFQYFTESMQKEALDRMQLSRDLYAALQKDQFYIEYQPIVSLTDGKIHKAEALLRWVHPERGLISSAEFIPIAEENGTINRIGEWVFSNVIKTVRHWRAVYDETFQISINASPLQFREGYQQIESWHEKMTAVGLSGDAILIEITEGLIMDHSPNVTNKLLMLRDAGIQVALDDFGTGYSSLAYLQKLDIDYLKIDKSFVDNLKPGSNEEALCQAIIVMAHRLKLRVVAEGIETEEQYAILQSSQCDFGQGYLFSKSLSVTDFEHLLSKN
ncbi:MAG: putative bifunctional diguanylate cyclase/phosphodiesterase [Cellvibrionaceae bacterium]